MTVTEVLIETACFGEPVEGFFSYSLASMKRPFGFGSAGEEAETGVAAICFGMAFTETTKLCRGINNL